MSVDSSSNGIINDEFTVALEGGRPWGFTLSGGADFRSPLKIGKVTPGGKAEKMGLVAGDVILGINGVTTQRMKHHEAQRLIVAAKTTLELLCTKIYLGAIVSPKSSTQIRSFDFSHPPRSTTPVDNWPKSNTLGRHARQSSLDLQTFRSRSSSDVGKRAVAGVKIAGITVPAPPPSVKQKADSNTEVTIPRYVAGIKVPAPPSIRSKSTGSMPYSSDCCSADQTNLLTSNGPSSDLPLILNGEAENKTNGVHILETEVKDDKTPEPVICSYDVTLETVHHVTAGEISSELKVKEMENVNNEANDILSAIQFEFGSLRDKSDDFVTSPKATETYRQSEIPVIMTSDANKPYASHKDKESYTSSSRDEELSLSIKDDRTFALSSEEVFDDLLKTSGSGGSDWYRSMFQSMKKGVEEQLPNKKHVCDRDPIPDSSGEEEFSLSSKDDKSFTSCSEKVFEDLLHSSGSGGNDWYKSMFQNMKKGVEEQLPNKKHVCDRSPVPARKSAFEFSPKTEPPAAKPAAFVQSYSSGSNTSPKRRSSESNLPSPTRLAPKSKSMTRASSSGTVGVGKAADAVNTLTSGVVFRKNMQNFKQSCSYWKSIERQASQERIEIANQVKRSSLRRSSSASSSGGRGTSPELLKEEEVTTPTDKTALIFQEVVTVLTDQTIIKEEVEEGSVPRVTTCPETSSPHLTTSLESSYPEVITPPETTYLDVTRPPEIGNHQLAIPLESSHPKVIIPLVNNHLDITTHPESSSSQLRTPLQTSHPQVITPPETTCLDVITPPETSLPEVTPPSEINTDIIIPTEANYLEVNVSPVISYRDLTTFNINHSEVNTLPETIHIADIVQERKADNMSKLHPLLAGELNDDQDSPSSDEQPQQDLFSRIDPSKLNAALGNAAVLGKLEQEGVSPVALQSAAIAVGQQSRQEDQPKPHQKKKVKSVKPPPGEKAQTLFDFVADNEKEVSFKKGAIIDLIEQVDANWLKGTIDGNTGIFPVSFVKVLTVDDIIQLQLGSDPSGDLELNLLAKAKYNFTAKSNKELSFRKGDILTLLRQIDDNWYEGTVGEDKGIIPANYIQVFEASTEQQ